jgi:DNA-binding transcriptional MerR regulator
MTGVSPAAVPASGGSCGLYGLSELLALASERLGEELSARTVRLYATDGLIDRPAKEGRRAVYGQRHLLQLLLVRSLARRGLSLSAIAPLVVCSNQELLQQLNQLEGGAESAGSVRQGNEALAYLQNMQASSPSGNAPSLLPLLGSNLSGRSASLAPRRSLSPRSAGSSSGASSRWHRFLLAPGVEVHLSESASIPPAGARREAWLQRLIERLREQLDVQE